MLEHEYKSWPNILAPVIDLVLVSRIETETLFFYTIKSALTSCKIELSRRKAAI